MSWTLIVVWLIVLLPVQSSLLPHIAIEHAVPDLLLIFVLYVCLYTKKPDVFWAAWLIGLMRDMYSEQPLGLHAASYVLFCLAMCRLRREIFIGHALTRMVLTALTSIALGALGLVLTLALHPHVCCSVMVRHVALAAVYTTLVCPAAYWVFDLVRLHAR